MTVTKAERDQLRLRVADRAKVRTHFDGCHLEPDHRDCAIVRLLDALDELQAAIMHAAEQFDVSDEDRAEDAPCAADSHFREAIRTIARTLPPSTVKVDRAAIWGELREMDRLHIDNAKLSADLAESKAKLAALVDAASEVYEHAYGDLDRHMDPVGMVLRGNLGDALAAARGVTMDCRGRVVYQVAERIA